MIWSTPKSRADENKSRSANTARNLLEDALIAGDIVVGTALGYLAIHIYYYCIGSHLAVQAIGLPVWRQLILASVIAALVIRMAEGQTTVPADDACVRSTVLAVLGRATCAGTLLVAVGVATEAFHDLSRLWLLVWAALFIGWMCSSRLLLLAYRRRAAGNARGRETIAIIGAGRTLAMLAARLSDAAYVTTLIDHTSLAGHALAEAVAKLVGLASEGAVGLVVLATEADETPQALDRILECLKAAPLRVALYSPGSRTLVGAQDILSIAGIPMTLITDRPLSRRDMLIKMLVDKLGALLLLVLILPLLLAITLAILLETGGPIIFKQRRNGWCGRLFTVYKFRTMRHEPGQHVLYQTHRVDPRCTRIGAFLRRSSLDELPQLWNVLRGDMSLVGPRPHADFMHARERASCGPVANYVQRQRVKPGLTGWAQVHGLRGAADTPEKLRQRVEFDRYYIEHWSVWLDLKILAQTPWAVFSRENAF